MCIASRVKDALNGEDYDQGQLETIDATVNNLKQCLGNLIQHLEVEGILSEDTIKEVILNNVRSLYNF